MVVPAVGDPVPRGVVRIITRIPVDPCRDLSVLRDPDLPLDHYVTWRYVSLTSYVRLTVARRNHAVSNGGSYRYQSHLGNFNVLDSTLHFVPRRGRDVHITWRSVQRVCEQIVFWCVNVWLVNLTVFFTTWVSVARHLLAVHQWLLPVQVVFGNLSDLFRLIVRPRNRRVVARRVKRNLFLFRVELRGTRDPTNFALLGVWNNPLDVSIATMLHRPQ